MIAEFDALGAAANARSARRFLLHVEHRLGDAESVLLQLQRDERTARATGDDHDLARIYGAMASCYTAAGNLTLARECVDLALSLAAEYGMEVLTTQLMRVSALVTLRGDMAAGLREIAVVRERCRALGMPVEGITCLLSAVESVLLLDPAADVAALCRSAYTEAVELSITAGAAEAAANLRDAAAARTATTEMVRDVRLRITTASVACADTVN